MSNGLEMKTSKGKSCLKCFNLLLNALPSIVFGVFTIAFTLSQNDMARKNREQDQRQTDEQNIRMTFENYIKDISSLLLDGKFNRSNIEHLLQVRVKTLTTLRYLDGTRRRDIILFLYESGLLRTTTDGKPFLHLTNANLTDVEFIGSSTMKIDLDRLNLAGVYAPNIVFIRCSLSYASFDRATLINAKFISSTLTNTSFYAIIGSGVTMIDVMFYGNNFRDAKLQGIHLISVSTLGTIDLTNSDLFDNSTNCDRKTLQIMLSSPLVILDNARLVDGSYGPINNSNQIKDGDAEEICSNGRLSDVWLSGYHPKMEIISIDQVDRNQFGRCSFVARKFGKSSIEQEIHPTSFSVLIDSGSAAYNLTATLGCYGSKKNEISLMIQFYKENFLWIAEHQKFNTTDHLQTNSFIGQIPRETSILIVLIESNIVDTNGFCLADNVEMTILRN